MINTFLHFLATFRGDCFGKAFGLALLDGQKDKKTGKVRSKAEKRCSKTGSSKTGKDNSKQERTF